MHYNLQEEKNDVEIVSIHKLNKDERSFCLPGQVSTDENDTVKEDSFCLPGQVSTNENNTVKEDSFCLPDTVKGKSLGVLDYKLHIEDKKHISKYYEVCSRGFEEDFTPLSPCGHYIHIECVVKSGEDKCPICRNKVLLNETYIKRLKRLLCKRKAWLAYFLPLFGLFVVIVVYTCIHYF
jgi:hypothetical protein